MNNFLTELAALSLGGAIAIGLAVLIRHFTLSRYAARWRCWVWLVLCLRLLIPFSLWRVITYHPIFITVPPNVVLYQPDEVTDVLPEQSAFSTAPELIHEAGERIDPVLPAVRLYDVLGAIWIAGAATVVMWAAAAHIRFCSYLRRWSEQVTDADILHMYRELTEKMKIRNPPKLRICAGLNAPMLVGIFQSSILLPENAMDSQIIQHTLLHELTHFERNDIGLKTLALLDCAIHWFNPLVWYMSRIIAQDTELACDETLLCFLPSNEYTAYCSTILKSVKRVKKKGVQK